MEYIKISVHCIKTFVFSYQIFEKQNDNELGNYADFLEEVATGVDEGKPFDVMYLDLQKYLVRYHMKDYL